MTGSSQNMEYCSPDDRYFSYCLWEYLPVALPAGKLRAANLLYHSFAIGAAHADAFTMVRLIREAFGVGNTVWGVKLIDGELKWEFYIYDYRRRNRERSVARFADAVAPLIPCRVPVNDHPHYFMFSVDMDNLLLSGARELDEIHMYVGNVGSNLSSGISYSVTAAGSRLENLYYFFKPQEHRDDILGKICCSAYLDVPQIDMDSILWPELASCRSICLANKQHNDCIYYSGLTVDQLLFAMNRLAYPAELVAFISSNKARLDHLLYDFGVDYTLKDGRMVVVKSGYYGTF
jgi:hypothetical protein